MQKIIIILIAFVVLLLSPIVSSTIYYKKRKGEILNIKQSRVRDERYFGKSFSAFIKKQLPKAEGNTITLSKKEKFLDEKQVETCKGTVKNLVISKSNEFCSSESIQNYEKEIYGENNVVLDTKPLKIRAAYAGKNMIIGNNVQVTRWVDAEETLAIYDDCHLGVSATAGKRMSIGKGCYFRRLYAPEILLGQYPESNANAFEGKDLKVLMMPVQKDRKYSVRYLNEEDENEEGIVDFTVLTGANLKVEENMIVQGDIRTHKGIRIYDGAVVCGNIFAEKDIYIGKDAVILGNVFSQGDIHLEDHVTIGHPNHISSVISRKNIYIGKDCFAYGYISCEGQGVVAERKEYDEDEEIHTEFTYLQQAKYETNISFDTVEKYEAIDPQYFRKNNHIETVRLPLGVKEIYQSMFFKCENLKEINFSQTVEEIKPYAFAECVNLNNISTLAHTNLKTIGVSAFEKCKSLNEVSLPSTIEILDNGAFSECEQLKSINISKLSNLKKIGNHCFNNCRKLEEIYLPSTVEYIGMSAFRECSNLKKISLPVTCKEQLGIQELLQNKPNMEWIWREV